MTCGATRTAHCCWIGGEECRHLYFDADKPVCTLRAKYGSWPAAHASPEYQANVKPTMVRLGMDCGDWPGKTCATCGASGG